MTPEEARKYLERLQAAGANDMGQNEVWEILNRALCDMMGEDSCCWICDIFPDYLIYERDAHFYRMTYSIDGSGKATLGTPAEVNKEVSYVPVKAASQILAAVGAPESDEYGFVWRVQINKYGLGKDGRINWTRDPLVAAIPLIEGARVFALNDSQHQAAGKPFGKSVKEIVGWLKNVADTGSALEGDLYILKSAKWLRDGLVDSFQRGKPDLFGLSFDALGKTVSKMLAGKKVLEPVQITSVEVDVVYDPTNDGKFIRMAAAAVQEKEEEMLKKLLAALVKAAPDLHQQITAGMENGSMSEDQAIEKIVAALQGEKGTGVEALVAALKSDSGSDVQMLRCEMTLDRQLQAAKLPEKAEKQIREQFGGKVFEETSLTAAIQGIKELLDDVTGSGHVQGMGGTRVGAESIDKIQAACDKMLNLQVKDDVKDVESFTSLRAAYVAITGDAEVRGYVEPGEMRRLQAAGFDSATFAFVLGNTLYRRMVADYREINDYGVSLLVGGNIRNARDFRSLETVRIAYFSDLPTVDPENDSDYADLGTLSDEKVDYTLGQKGGIITVSRKMIINDDIRAIDTIRRRLPRAARRTLAKSVWAHLINNVVYKGDNKAVFHADHANLDTTAFGLTAITGMKTRMYKQTEPQSGEVLALRLKVLAIPEDLWGTATGLNQTQNFLVNGTTTQGNPFYHYFGVNNENIVEIPFMTDATDFIGLADPNECEIIELAFLNGQQEPEMFVADNPNFGQFFIGDRIQYKIGQEYNSVPTDFRGVQKNVVA